MASVPVDGPKQAPGETSRGVRVDSSDSADRGSPSRRLRSLDALRGIAAMLVVIGHSVEMGVRELPLGSAGRVAIEAVTVEYMNLGRVGVVAFFLLSGYVVPFSFSHVRPVRSFLIARLFRLYPAYWASMLAAIALALILSSGPPSAVQILANATMVQKMLGQPDLIPVYWTLFYELLFYAACLGAFLIGKMESPQYLASVVVGLMTVGLAVAFARYAGVTSSAPIGVPMFLGIMHLGTLARLSDRGDVAGAHRHYRIALVAVLLCVGPITALGFIPHGYSERLIASVAGLYAGLALFLPLRRSELVCRPLFLWLGLISYSLYLIHPLVLDLVVAVVREAQPWLRIVIIVVMVPLGAMLFAAVLQRYVEVPANRLGKQVRIRAAAA